MNLIDRDELNILLDRELENGAESTKDGLRLAIDILKYTPPAKETLWQHVKRILRYHFQK